MIRISTQIKNLLKIYRRSIDIDPHSRASVSQKMCYLLSDEQQACDDSAKETARMSCQ